MVQSRVKISYSAPTLFLASDQWIQIRTALDAHLPLRNLHWRSPTRTSIRTIQELDIDLINLDSLRDEGASQIPTSLLERPFMNLFIFACEDNEQYRNTFKKQIKDWLTLVTSPRRSTQEWLIILIVRPDARTGGSRLFQIRAPILDKVKADFNVGRRDRCVELGWPVGQDDAANWTDLIAKLKEGILTTFDAYVTAREEEIKRSEGQRMLPGWNFCTFFILKESLAASFEGMNLVDEAQLQYDELEASFFQALKEKNLSWFGKLGGNVAGDDSNPILDVDTKPYRDLILANAISLFDFRIYLFACQCAILGRQGRVTDVMSKAQNFIGSFGKILRESENSFTTFFLESWIYSAAVNVTAHCETWATKVQLDGQQLTAFNARKGELLELARNQLDKLGMHVGHLPNKPPFSLSWHGSCEMPRFADGQPLSTKISRTELVEALRDQKAFDKLYIEMTQRAIDMYAKGHRRKFALKLHGTLAALDFHRGRFPTAHQTFSSLPAHYTGNKWPPLEAFMLARSLDSHRQLGKPKDKEWLNNALTFLKAWAIVGGSGGPQTLALPLGAEGSSADDRKAYLDGLVQDIVETARSLSEPLVIEKHPIFSIRILGDAKCSDQQDGSFLEVLVRNHLPCTVLAGAVLVQVSGTEDDELLYCSRPTDLLPGDTTVSLFCSAPAYGPFLLARTELRISNVHLQWNYSKEGERILSPTSPTLGSRPIQSQAESVLVQVPKDPHALDVRVALPRIIKLDGGNHLILNVHSGRNEIDHAKLRVEGPTDLKFYVENASVLTESKVRSWHASQEGIEIHGVGKNEIIAISIPHSYPSQGSVVIALIEVAYQAGRGDDLEEERQPLRTVQIARKISIGLPVQVNVRDFFRGKRLFSKFTISTHMHQQVRIFEAKLEGGTGLEIKPCRPAPRRAVVTVAPQRPAHFLFQIDSQEQRAERETLRLSLMYRTLREEIEAKIAYNVKQVLSGGREHLQDPAIGLLVDALSTSADWVELYVATGELEIVGLDKEQGELGDAVRAVALRLNSGGEGSIPPSRVDDWRQLMIPVDLPFLNILSAVKVNFINCDGPMYAGQPVLAQVVIHNSFHWGSVGYENPEFRMRYDVEERVKDWLVSGRKRGDFIAKDGEEHIVPLTLIPLHHGELTLPQVTVHPLPMPTAPGMRNASLALPSSEYYQLNAAEKVMVLPRGGRSTFVVGMGGED